jgi:hypothetical protein
MKPSISRGFTAMLGPLDATRPRASACSPLSSLCSLPPPDRSSVCRDHADETSETRERKRKREREREKERWTWTVE